MSHQRNITKEETDVLKTCLKIAQDDIASLLEEKSSLMDTIKALQVGKTFETQFSHLNIQNFHDTVTTHRYRNPSP